MNLSLRMQKVDEGIRGYEYNCQTNKSGIQQVKTRRSYLNEKIRLL